MYELSISVSNNGEKNLQKPIRQMVVMEAGKEHNFSENSFEVKLDEVFPMNVGEGSG